MNVMRRVGEIKQRTANSE